MLQLRIVNAIYLTQEERQVFGCQRSCEHMIKSELSAVASHVFVDKRAQGNYERPVSVLILL